MKQGFTLIEMLVVIAILGILASLVIPASTNAFASAHETTCRNNLRNLHSAAINHANDKDGELPRAGSFETLEAGPVYVNHPGWITWTHTGGNYPYRDGQKTPQLSSMMDGWTVGSNLDVPRAMFAITNGTLFAYTNGDLGIYVCPEAVKKEGFSIFGKRKGFSTYVMNEFFMYEGSHGGWSHYNRWMRRIGTSSETIPDSMDNSGDFKGFKPSASNLLLFAEHDAEKPKAKTFSIGHNCVLHVPWSNPDDKKAGVLGAHHGKKNNPVGLAIFLDGHITLEHPQGTVGDIKNTAYWLCRGEFPEKEGE